jgi:hypothetical protein
VTEVTVTKAGISFLVEQRRDRLMLITPHIIDDLVAPTGQ